MKKKKEKIENLGKKKVKFLFYKWIFQIISILANMNTADNIAILIKLFQI